DVMPAHPQATPGMTTASRRAHDATERSITPPPSTPQPLNDGTTAPRATPCHQDAHHDVQRRHAAPTTPCCPQRRPMPPPTPHDAQCLPPSPHRPQRRPTLTDRPPRPPRRPTPPRQPHTTRHDAQRPHQLPTSADAAHHDPQRPTDPLPRAHHERQCSPEPPTTPNDAPMTLRRPPPAHHRRAPITPRPRQRPAHITTPPARR
ncbi:hypothetical protein H0H92_014065, partial [Tricholoma furcatifolium]